MYFRPVVDEEKRDRVQALVKLQLICFGLQLIAGVTQVVLGALLCVLSCRALRLFTPSAPVTRHLPAFHATSSGSGGVVGDVTRCCGFGHSSTHVGKDKTLNTILDVLLNHFRSFRRKWDSSGYSALYHETH
jgi:hypothetical protein